MTLATMTGLVKDFAVQPISGLGLTLEFRGSGTGITGAYLDRILLSEQPVIVTPVDGTGYFTVDLESTDDITPQRFYIITAKWLWPDGGLYRQEVVPFPLYVPTGGGNVGNNLVTPGSFYDVWTESTDNPAYRFWFDGRYLRE